jgi:hypothetical protein
MAKQPRVSRREVLGFFGDNKGAAWDKAFQLGEVITRRGDGKRMGVKPEKQYGEWVVVLCHYER